MCRVFYLALNESGAANASSHHVGLNEATLMLWTTHEAVGHEYAFSCFKPGNTTLNFETAVHSIVNVYLAAPKL